MELLIHDLKALSLCGFTCEVVPGGKQPRGGAQQPRAKKALDTRQEEVVGISKEQVGQH